MIHDCGKIFPFEAEAHLNREPLDDLRVALLGVRGHRLGVVVATDDHVVAEA